MKKIVIIVLACILGVNVTQAQEFDNIDTNDVVDTGAQISEHLTEAMKPAVDAFGAAVASMADSFAQMASLIEVCRQEDKKSPITDQMANDIITVIAPDHVKDFNIDLEGCQQSMNFAKGNFNIDKTNVNIELAKTHCLYIADNIADIFDEIPAKTSEAIAEVVPQANIENNIPESSNKMSYIVADDEISADKFSKSKIKDMNVLKFVDNEKQSAYAMMFLGTLGIKIKTQNGNYQEIMERFLQYIDVEKLQQIVGKESPQDIRTILEEKVKANKKNLINITDENVQPNSEEIIENISEQPDEAASWHSISDQR